MFFGIYAVPESFLVWNIIENMDYRRVLSNCNCLLIFSFGEMKAEMKASVCLPKEM